MGSRIDFLDDDIFTIANVFRKEESRLLIDRAETIGFAEASVRTRSGQKMMKELRNNDRVNLVDAELAQEMWTRVCTDLPAFNEQVAVGIDDRLRFYRYMLGQRFRRHKDGSVTNEAGQRSLLSYLIYLNDDFDGGETVFRDYVESDGDQRERQEKIIVPTVGMALLFRHSRWHEGSPVTDGRKYVLRSDVFYADC